jgi:uncharacterized protein (DUF2141 family)
MMKMRNRNMTRVLATLLWMMSLLLPGVATAQSSIVGVVKDKSGAVMPGVTIEASSPALVERAKAVVTDASGNYHISDLRPGVYAVRFLLQGFKTVSREGLGVTSEFTATVNADMRVGALEETLTVTGASPIVDTHGAHKVVLTRELMDAFPSGRQIQYIGALVSGAGVLVAQGIGGRESVTSTANLPRPPEMGRSRDRQKLADQTQPNRRHDWATWNSGGMPCQDMVATASFNSWAGTCGAGTSDSTALDPLGTRAKLGQILSAQHLTSDAQEVVQHSPRIRARAHAPTRLPKHSPTEGDWLRQSRNIRSNVVLKEARSTSPHYSSCDSTLGNHVPSADCVLRI